MPSFTVNETGADVRSGLSSFELVCLSRLVGRTFALIERELILQTLRSNNGNRTRAATILGISVRGLREKIRHYKARGLTVPEPEGSMLNDRSAELRAASPSRLEDKAERGVVDGDVGGVERVAG
jgi:Bacterial regulatory protein, Fis family